MLGPSPSSASRKSSRLSPDLVTCESVYLSILPPAMWGRWRRGHCWLPREGGNLPRRGSGTSQRRLRLGCPAGSLGGPWGPRHPSLQRPLLTLGPGSCPQRPLLSLGSASRDAVLPETIFPACWCHRLCHTGSRVTLPRPLCSKFNCCTPFLP